MTFYFDDEALGKLQNLLGDPSLQEYITKDRQEEHARGMRGEVTANWLDNVVNSMYNESVENNQGHLINEATGSTHTVESMVQQYRNMVGLDCIQKSAGANLPLSKKQAADYGISELFEAKKKEDSQDIEANDVVLMGMLQSISDHISSHRGYVDNQAIIFDLRGIYGKSVVDEHRDRLDEEINLIKKQYGQDDPRSMLPYAGRGQPIKVDFSPSDDDTLFKSIKDQGGSVR